MIFLVVPGNFYNDYKFQNKRIISDIHNKTLKEICSFKQKV